MRPLRRALVSIAPTRLDFGGGWTDVPPYPEERGGFVCNIAITRYATARISTSHTSRGDIETSRADIAPAIVRAALARHGDPELNVTLSSDYPIGAGLGGSSAAGVALSAALRAIGGHDVHSVESRDAIAESSRSIEVDELGIPGGRQDHYAAAYGGALGIEFNSGTVARHIHLAPETIEELEQRCIVAHTGQSRISGVTISGVLDAYARRERPVVEALERMKTLALGMRDALASGDVDELAALVDEHWIHQRTLHPAITTERIDALGIAAWKAGAIGMKALGASGGGCVIVFTRAGERHVVEKAIGDFSEPVPWRIAHQGVTVREQTGVMSRPSNARDP